MLQQNLYKTATFKKNENWFSRLMQVKVLQNAHSAILLTFNRLPFVIKIFVWSIFERPFYTGFTVCLLENSKISSTFQGLRLNDEPT